MIKYPSLLTAILSLGLFAGCESLPKMQSEVDPSADIASYQTYTLLPFPKSISGGDPGLMLRYGKILQDSINLALDIKGYDEVENASDADFAVLLKGSYVPKTEITDWGMGMGMSGYSTRGYWGRGRSRAAYAYRDIDIDNYEEGTVIIEIIDTKTKSLAWVGWVTGRKNSKPSEDERVIAVMNHLLSDFPSKIPAGEN